MKRIPQFELPIPDEPFALVSEPGTDGERITRERERSASDRTAVDKLATELAFPPREPPRS